MDRKVSRHELKYLISCYNAEMLRHRLGTLLRSDPHTGPDGDYFIRSVYFDDAYFTAYNEKLGGVKERTKYRLRFYNMDDRVIFLEKKSKDGDLTGKDSVRVDRETAEMLLSGKGDLRGCGGLLESFWRLRQGSYKPVVIVDYDRYPFIYTDGNVRVTIDSAVRTTPYCTDMFNPALPTVPVLDEGETVLEVKYDAFLPAQVKCLLQGVPMQRSSVSKYTKCLGILE